jgi:hypothetical protein
VERSGTPPSRDAFALEVLACRDGALRPLPRGYGFSAR